MHLTPDNRLKKLIVIALLAVSGIAQAALDIAVAYARDRRSFDKPIIDHQAVGFRLADLATQLEAARQLVLHAAALKDVRQSSARPAMVRRSSRFAAARRQQEPR